MKTIAVLLLGFACSAVAQQLQVLHHFTRGEGPIAPLVLGQDGNIYGTAPGGGSAHFGRIFRLTPPGTVGTLVDFNGTNGQIPWNVALVTDRPGNLYGTTLYGGTGERGTLFKVNLDGQLTTLVHFNGTNGADPRGLTIDRDGNLYGTTITSSANGFGTVYKLSPEGTFTTLADEFYPISIIMGRDGNLYGRTVGSAYRVTPNGAYTQLAFLTFSPDYATGLTQGRDGNFYGTTFDGGSYRVGTAFRMTPDGTVTTLATFDRNNGAYPSGPLTLGPDGNFYGATSYGGAFEGTVFRMTPNGAITTLAHFTARETGVRPYGGVIFGSDGRLYGTASTGGSGESGTIFRVELPPDTDSDDDGVLDSEDQCPGTAPHAVVNERGCSIDQLVPCAGPITGGTWRNHAEYTSAVKAVANAFLAAGLITESERHLLARDAARSDCGKQQKP